MGISFIIVNYYSSVKTAECISSIINHSRNGEYEIIIIDNSVNDDEVNALKKLSNGYKNIQLLVNPLNHGYGKASNLGAAVANYGFLFFVNPDVNILSNPFSLLEAYHSLEKPGAVSGIADGYSGFYFPSYLEELLDIFFLGRRLNLLFSKLKSNFKKDAVAHDWVSGGCLLINKEVFNNVNGFDEDFFLYYEDVDLCKRLKKNGFKNFTMKNFKIEHSISSRAAGNFIYNFYKSKKLYHTKYGSNIESLINAQIRARIFVNSLMGKKDKVKEYKKIVKGA